MLFHYHLWTPFVEETESFYKQLGFQVTQRIGKHEGEFKAFNPPLDWNDFRHQHILFRIIEMKRGTIDITFGYGKKVIFEHIGFLLTEADQVKTLQRAENLGLTVQANERRAFIQTPYGFRIELQTHFDAIQSNSGEQLLHLRIDTPKIDLEMFLHQLINRSVPEIISSQAKRTVLTHVTISSEHVGPLQDPNGIEICTVSSMLNQRTDE